MNWTVAALAEVCEVILGQSPPGSSYNVRGNGLPFFQGSAEFGYIFPTAAKWATKGEKRARPGDVLLSVRAPVGPTNLAPYDCIIGRGLAALRAGRNIEPRYLLWAMRYTSTSLTAQASGSTFAAVTASQVRSHSIPLAPIREQRRIVDAIEELFSHLDAADKMLQLAAARLRLQRKLMFDLVKAQNGATRRLSTVARVVSGQTPKGLVVDDHGDIPFFKVGDMNICRSYVMHRARGYVSNELAANLKLHVRPAGTVIFPKRGGAIATNKKRILGVPAALDLNTMGVIPTSVLESKFLLYWLETIDLATLSDGSNVPQINHGDIEPLMITVPPLAIQARIITEIETRLTSIDQLIGALERAQLRSCQLRRSVLEQALTGKLLPQSIRAPLALAPGLLPNNLDKRSNGAAGLSAGMTAEP